MVWKSKLKRIRINKPFAQLLRYSKLNMKTIIINIKSRCSIRLVNSSGYSSG